MATLEELAQLNSSVKHEGKTYDQLAVGLELDYPDELIIHPDKLVYGSNVLYYFGGYFIMNIKGQFVTFNDFFVAVKFLLDKEEEERAGGEVKVIQQTVSRKNGKWKLKK